MDWNESESDNQAVYSAYNSDSEQHNQWNKPVIKPYKKQMIPQMKRQIQMEVSKSKVLPRQLIKQQVIFQKRKQCKVSQKKPPHQEFKQKQGKQKIEKIKEAPIEQFKLAEEYITCQICWKFAKNALICPNERCQKIFCQLCTINLKNKIEDKCPFCRSSPFNCVPSKNRQAINSMKLICSLCTEKYLFLQEETHYKKKCSFYTKTQCKFCSKLIPKEEIVYHTKLRHASKIEDIISFMYDNPAPLLDPQKVINKNKIYLSRIHRQPKLGNTGKFYCGGKLETKCDCCNGFCGPGNGQNCFSCMKLDIQRLGLPKGYLVNSSGKICCKKGEDFVCGVRLPYEGTSCKQGNSCNACRNMKTNIKRYQDLI